MVEPVGGFGGEFGAEGRVGDRDESGNGVGGESRGDLFAMFAAHTAYCFVHKQNESAFLH